MKVSTSIRSMRFKVNNYLLVLLLLCHVYTFLSFFFFFFLYSNRVIEICIIIIARLVHRHASFVNRSCRDYRTYSVLRSRWKDRWTRPSCCWSWARFWSVPRPSVVHYVPRNVPNGSDVFHADVEESCWCKNVVSINKDKEKNLTVLSLRMKFIK